jgi:hypothetical protein
MADFVELDGEEAKISFPAQEPSATRRNGGQHVEISAGTLTHTISLHFVHRAARALSSFLS